MQPSSLKIVQRHKSQRSHPTNDLPIGNFEIFLLVNSNQTASASPSSSMGNFLAFVSFIHSFAAQQMSNRQNHSVGFPSANTEGKLTCLAAILQTTLCYQCNVLRIRSTRRVTQGTTNNERSITNSTPGPIHVPGPTTHTYLY